MLTSSSNAYHSGETITALQWRIYLLDVDQRTDFLRKQVTPIAHHFWAARSKTYTERDTRFKETWRRAQLLSNQWRNARLASTIWFVCMAISWVGHIEMLPSRSLRYSHNKSPALWNTVTPLYCDRYHIHLQICASHQDTLQFQSPLLWVIRCIHLHCALVVNSMGSVEQSGVTGS